MNEPQPSAGRVLLVRHGESEGNRARTFTASPEVPLTELGREQARNAAVRIAEICRPARLVSSPYARARQTAEIVAAHLRLPVEVDDSWREQDLGRLAGRPYDEARRDPTFDKHRPWQWRPPDGESVADVRRRVAPALDRLIEQTAGTDVVVVTHAGVMKALWAHAAGTWVRAPVPANGGIMIIEHAGGVPKSPRLAGDDPRKPAAGIDVLA